MEAQKMSTSTDTEARPVEADAETQAGPAAKSTVKFADDSQNTTPSATDATKRERAAALLAALAS